MVQSKGNSERTYGTDHRGAHAESETRDRAGERVATGSGGGR
ncbi:hypothetical protein [Halorussus halobius]|nr:hypothetical protein [Halorussus halobius]